ncbi:EamA family transporter [Flagellimonas taeanensis]|jgi:drug/metabolite transporter (DMT)-like permease|uniref:Permease of the drug/metabolite transporter (DMT) superfamily n=1 Tax=Flagellimonas taeanensis TaxID=1005926 RepID=A0A1M6ZSK6_9FLAO|nr:MULTISPECIES: EamA family transporter [Allomuricauda]MDC6386303.1 EamA family transporter [Muricauda sp. SK9]MEE1963461.1 EamA family transporter [Allomuricauda taeanensis]RIV48021.1 EamA family transporter [Allomuricauda taeanensis]SFC28980.1 Permease of the drug/metabolite transporter (DMT) superfamily [Allomuricauda taeanensis]SHL33452.1 Permease of the drug/metabolite transporter (DMT) superfamily [Allomuricauda taeanensis]
MGKSSKSVLVILAFFAIYVIWGSTYLLNKVAVQELEPFMLASCRFTTAGILIFILAKIMGIPLKITKKQLWNTIIAGILFLSFGNGVVVWALKYVDSGFAALEISAQPLIILLLMRVLQGKKIQPMSVIGVILGIVGIYLLVSQKQIIAKEESIIGMVMIFFCMLSWAYGSLFVAKADLPNNYFVNTGYQMFTAGITLALMSLAFGESWSAPLNWSGGVQLSMVLLIVFGSILAFTSFNYLLKAVSPEKVATSTYVNPIVALLLGWYFLDEQITAQSIVAATILLTGVYFINTKKTLAIFERFKR